MNKITHFQIVFSIMYWWVTQLVVSAGAAETDTCPALGQALRASLAAASADPSWTDLLQAAIQFETSVILQIIYRLRLCRRPLFPMISRYLNREQMYICFLALNRCSIDFHGCSKNFVIVNLIVFLLVSKLSRIVWWFCMRSYGFRLLFQHQPTKSEKGKSLIKNDNDIQA